MAGAPLVRVTRLISDGLVYLSVVSLATKMPEGSLLICDRLHGDSIDPGQVALPIYSDRRLCGMDFVRSIPMIAAEVFITPCD